MIAPQSTRQILHKFHSWGNAGLEWLRADSAAMQKKAILVDDFGVGRKKAEHKSVV